MSPRGIRCTSPALPRAQGLDGLREAVRGRISALSGPSGVGKSSLMNALFPGLDLRVGAISDSVNKGRHTTVGALLHPLPGGGFIADTPGLREVGLWGIDAARRGGVLPGVPRRTWASAGSPTARTRWSLPAPCATRWTPAR